MRHDDEPAKADQSQVAGKALTAERDLQLGQLIQKIVYLGLPFNNRQLRFMQWLANSTYLTCLLGGFMRLWQTGADWTTLLLLCGGGGLLSLTCLYYAWFWQPAVQAQRLRQLAIAGVFAIPLLTGAGFLVWQSLPPPNVLLLVANFANTHHADNRDDLQLTEAILRNVGSAIEPDKEVKLQGLRQRITEQQGSEFARTEGERRKATLVLWGDYAPTNTNAEVSVHFELLRHPPAFPGLGATAKGQTAAIAEPNSFKLQTRLSQEMTYLTLFTLGMVRYAKADWDGAVNRFSAALSWVKEPVTALSQPFVYFCRADSYSHQGNYDAAITDYNQALKLKPDYAEAYNNRGTAYNHQGKYDAAITDFSQALKLKPDFAAAYYNRGNAYNEQGKYNAAITDYNQALKLKPDDVKAYTNRGNAYADQGNYDAAITDYNQALKLKPDDAKAYNNRGTAYNQQGNAAAAITDYTQALKLQPNDADAYYNRGIAYARQGNAAAAITDYTQALKLQPDYAEAYYNRGSVYDDQGNYAAAITDYTQALKLQPDDATAYYNRGIVYNHQGNYAAAITDYTQALKLQPDYVEAYYNRGIVYNHQGNYAAAITDYTQALKLHPRFAAAYYNRGLAYDHQGNYAAAITDFNQTLKLRPNDVAAYYNKARLYSLERKSKEAIEALQQAIQLTDKAREDAKKDADFNNLRQNKQFQALVGE